MSVVWRCSVCGSQGVRVMPAGGPFGHASRPVSGLWVSCLECFRWVFLPFAAPYPLASLLPFCGVFRQEEAKIQPQQPKTITALEQYGYVVDKETGEIQSEPQPSAASKVLDRVLGPKGTPGGKLGSKIYNTKPLSGWKQAVAGVLLGCVIVVFLLGAFGVIGASPNHLPHVNLECSSEWVRDIGWVQSCVEKGE